MDLFGRTEPVLRSRDLLQRPPPLPELRIRALTGQVHVAEKRDSDSSSSETETSGGSSTTPVVIGVVIPVLIIVIILFVIWRRRKSITRKEKANDKYKSLDFGVDGAALKEKKGRKKQEGDGPEMTIMNPAGTRKERGISLDMGATNPYLLPLEVHQSRESLHSLSRSINTGDDKYRATTFVPDDGSIRSPASLRSGKDDSSIWTASTHRRFDTESKTDLLPRMPQLDSPESPKVSKPQPVMGKPHSGLLAPSAPGMDRNSTLSTASSHVGLNALRTSNNYLGAYISNGQKPAESGKAEQPGLIATVTEIHSSPPAEEPRELPAAVVRNEPPKRQSSVYEANPDGHPVSELEDSHSAYHARHENARSPAHAQQGSTVPQIQTTSYELDDSSKSQFPQRSQSIRHPNGQNQPAERPPVPKVDGQHNQQHAHDDAASDYYEDDAHEEYEDYLGYTYRGSMMGTRPLPPDDPSENPEQRANRIRSFYKEYFDDGSSGAKPGQPRQTKYYDGSEQFDDVYGYYGEAPSQTYSRGPSIHSTNDGRHRAMSHGSHGYYNGPRAFSSMSGRMGPRPGMKMAPKKTLPPPKPLIMLPTPHKLKDDDFLPNAIDFAPPQMFKNQRAGTPDSLRGGMRPYSPSVRAHVPLTSAFDDLAVIPSP